MRRRGARLGGLAALLLLLLLLLLLAASAAVAEPCSVGVTGVSFGGYDVLDPAPLASMGSITYTCPPNDSIRIELSAGGSGSFFPREMANGAERLSYNLYRDAAATQVWGDGTAGTAVYLGTTGEPGPPGGRTFTVPVFGVVPPEQDVTVGVYSDTIVVTFVF